MAANENWIFTAEDVYPKIFFHDCYVDEAYMEGQDLVLTFGEDGFWVGADYEQNPFKKLLRTDKSQVRFVHVDTEFAELSLFKTHRLFRRQLWETRIHISLDDWVACIGRGRWQFEFVEELCAWRECFFSGVMHGKRKYDEWQMHLRYEKIQYFWNRICEDRPW